MQSSLARWLAGCTELLFPRECLVCTRPLRGASLCFRCAPPSQISAEFESRCHVCFSPLVVQCPRTQSIRCETCLLFPLVADRMRFMWDYGGLARDLIRAMKYRPSLVLARLCGEYLASNVRALFPNDAWDVIVPVPSSPSNVKSRYFHPCREVARPLVSVTGARCAPNALVHVGQRAPQATLSHRERLSAWRGMFTASGRCSLEGSRVLLVEDVVTTGATTTAASLALRRAGARSVDILALARTSVWSRFRRRVWEEARHEL